MGDARYRLSRNAHHSSACVRARPCADVVSFIFMLDVFMNFFFSFEVPPYPPLLPCVTQLQHHPVWMLCCAQVGDGDFTVQERRNSVIAVHYVKVRAAATVQCACVLGTVTYVWWCRRGSCLM